MSQPAPYNRTHDFVALQHSGPSGVFPANLVNSELDAITATFNEVLANLALIQRDDGALKNGIVTIDSLSAGVVAAIAAGDAGPVLASGIVVDPFETITATDIQSALQEIFDESARKADFDAHVSDNNNPHAVTKAQIGLGSVDNTSDLAKAISTATQTALNLKVDLTAIDTDATAAANSDAKVMSQKAARSYIATAVAGIGSGLNPKGNTDCSANPNYPSATKGDMYLVNVAGKIGGGSGITVAIGDFFYATANNAGGTQGAVGTSWSVVPLGTLGQAILSANNAFTGNNTMSGSLVIGSPTGGSKGAGTLNAGTLYEGGSLIPDIAFQATFLGGGTPASTSHRNRLKNSIRIPEDVSCDMTGGTANLHTALATAIGEAQARVRNEIIIGVGTPKLGGTVSVINKMVDGTKLRVIGYDQATRLTSDSTTRDWFTLGDASNTGTNRTAAITWEDMYIAAAATAGSIFKLRQCTSADDGQLVFRNVQFKGVATAFSLGVGGSSNDVVYLSILDCGFAPSTAGVAVIVLGSGGFLTIDSRVRSNGNGTSGLRFIQQTGTGNWDGLWGRASTEDFPKMIEVAGAGVSNLTWQGGGQMDRFVAGCIDTSNTAVGGLNKNWQLIGLQFNKSTGATTPIIWSKGSSANVPYGLTVSACNFNGNTTGPTIGAGAHAALVGNMFVDSSPGAPLINFTGIGNVASNTYYNTGAVAAPSVAIAWGGASNATNRVSSGNQFLGIADSGTR